MSISKRNNILFSPLDWGLGHTTRLSVLIKSFSKNPDFSIHIACNKTQRAILFPIVPDAHFIDFRGYNVQYSHKGFLFPLILLVQIPRLLTNIIKEHLRLKKLVSLYDINMVVSDNRLGFFHKRCFNVYMTHQLRIKAPWVWMEDVLQKLHYFFIHQFQLLLIPDLEGTVNLAGELSHPSMFPKIPYLFTGLLSRFELSAQSVLYDYCIILSGPEPQRTILETILYTLSVNTKSRIMFFRGNGSNKPPLPYHPNVKVVELGNFKEIEMAVCQSVTIISRSGYTTLMEILPMKKKLIVVPTPGQTEQLYLAERVEMMGWGKSILQNELEKEIFSLNDIKFLPIYPSFEKNDLMKILQKIIVQSQL